MCPSSNLSLRELSASWEVQVQDGDQASLRRVWTRRTAETVMWVPPASKARTRPTSRGCPLLRRFRLQLRLRLRRDSFALMS